MVKHFVEGIVLTIDTILCNAKVYYCGDLIEGGIAIDDGKIVKIAKRINLPISSQKIDLSGNIVLPGLIDIHVHLRDQDLAYKETFKTGTAAAAAGGVTSVIDMPNNNPVTMDSSAIKTRIKLAEKQVLVNVGFNSAFPVNLSEIPEIISSGAVGFKLYLSSKIGGINIDDDQLLFEAFEKVSENKVPILIHAEDCSMIQKEKVRFETMGRDDLSSYVASHSPNAEAKSIRRIVSIVKKLNVSVHFCHLSSEMGLNEILLAKKAGLPITCEVTPHNLFLSSEVYNRLGAVALTDPPLRKQKDSTILWNAVRLGMVDAVASDHAPHSLNEKKGNSIWDVSPGVPGLETTLSLLLDRVNKGQISLKELVRAVVERPAKIFNLTNRGAMLEGNWADLVVIDINREHKISASNFFSKAKYSPFDGLVVRGKPVKTFVNGSLVMDEGEMVEAPKRGKIL